MKKEIVLFALALITTAVLVWGCASQTCVVVTSQTGVGIVASYNAQSQMPEGKLGYLRNEVAIVPTNKTPDCAYEKDAKQAYQGGSGGAKDSPNVIMDFNLGNWFAFWENQNLSNRIAVGDKACKVAPFLFLQNYTPAQIEAMSKLAPVVHDLVALGDKEAAEAAKADAAAKIDQSAKVDTGIKVDTGR